MRKQIAAALVWLIVFGSCQPREPVGPDGHAVQTTLFLRADLTGTQVATVVVQVTAPDIATPVVFNIPIANGVAAGSITVLAGSQRTISLRAYDAGGVETHSGSVTLNIHAGTNTAISIVLVPHAGDVPITVTLGSFKVSVAPSPVFLPPGDVTTLAATVVDGDGNPVAAEVAWASLSSSVATVISTGPQTGRVTAAGVGQTTVVAVYGGAGGAAPITVAPVTATGPLRVSTVNPRYFTDGSGRAIYLTGSHTWPNFEDVGLTDPPAPFNFTAYLDFLQQHNHNIMKLWRWEQVKWSAETPNVVWIDPTPYLRPGPDLALDGKPKFDLTKFNPAYFARMRQRIIEAGQRGIYVSIMLFDGWSIEDKGIVLGFPWPGHPFNQANNINGINGDPNGDGEGLETHTMQIPAVVVLQEAYVRRVVDAVNDLDNVLYEISNESRTGSEAWEEHMIEFLHQYELTKPKQHPVGMSILYPGGDNRDLFASSADWIAPNGVTADLPPADGRKVILQDTDHLCGICIDEPWVWKSLTRGVNPMLMDPYDGAYAPTAGHYNLADPGWELVRTNMGYARTYANRMNLIAMEPRVDLASTAFCLANIFAPAAEYLVYLPTGGTVTVDLSATSGTLNVEWFDPRTGQTIAGGTVTGGSSQLFTTPAPISADAVLYLHQQ